jgi:hypothetical protein
MASAILCVCATIGAAQGSIVEDEGPTFAKRTIGSTAGGGTSSLVVPGADSCSTPDLIAGSGLFPFDNSVATTGAEGQTTTNCVLYNQNGIALDIWFLWTAPQNGRVLMTTCGQTTVDTKMAVYAGSACPAPGATAVACNDDITSAGVGNLSSWVEFDVLAGAQFLIQLGTYPLAALGGLGNLSIEYVGPAPCQYDDGTTDYASRVGTGGTVRSTGWMYSMGSVGTLTSVPSVSSAWGWTSTGTPLPPGLIAHVAVWEDPDDDGDPADAVLVATGAAQMVGQHTDALQTIAVNPVAILDGKFFVGAWVLHSIGFPIPRDILGCNGRPGVGWLVGNAGGPLNTMNLAANTDPPFQPPNGQTYIFLLRADCQPASVGTAFCAGDGVAPHTPCPCANHSSPNALAGCLNSFGVGGRLRASGVASLSADTVVLRADHLPASSVLFFQGTTQQGGGNGAPFGDGLRCAGGGVIRLRSYAATGTPGSASSTYPQGADPSVSQRGGVTVPGTRTYQAWYRNSAAFCTASPFNLSNGVEIAWSI